MKHPDLQRKSQEFKQTFNSIWHKQPHRVFLKGPKTLNTEARAPSRHMKHLSVLILVKKRYMTLFHLTQILTHTELEIHAEKTEGFTQKTHLNHPSQIHSEGRLLCNQSHLQYMYVSDIHWIYIPVQSNTVHTTHAQTQQDMTTKDASKMTKEILKVSVCVRKIHLRI